MLYSSFFFSSSLIISFHSAMFLNLSAGKFGIPGGSCRFRTRYQVLQHQCCSPWIFCSQYGVVSPNPLFWLLTLRFKLRAVAHPGATPQSGDKVSMAGHSYESAIWSYDASCKGITLHWVNYDGCTCLLLPSFSSFGKTHLNDTCSLRTIDNCMGPG